MLQGVFFMQTAITPEEARPLLVEKGWEVYSLYTAYWLAGLAVTVYFDVNLHQWMVTYHDMVACERGLHGFWAATSDGMQNEIHRRLEIGPVPEYLRISDPRRVTGERVYQHQRGEK
jgi:hypothetical protein